MQLLQLVDSSLLSSRGAYEREEDLRNVEMNYTTNAWNTKRSMIVYDLDSLIGVTESESDSSMGVSTSTNLVNHGVYIYVTSRFREAKIEVNREDQAMTKERWAVAVVRSPFLLKKFTADVDFALSESQNREMEESRKRDATVQCVKCREEYTENENNMNACNHHEGFVYDISAPDLTAYTPSEAIRQLTREEHESFQRTPPTITNPSGAKDELEKRKQRFRYICCSAVLAPGASLGGCKKSKHGWEELEQYKKRYPRLDKDPIALWEQACLTNRKNQEKKQAVLREQQNPASAAP